MYGQFKVTTYIREVTNKIFTKTGFNIEASYKQCFYFLRNLVYFIIFLLNNISHNLHFLYALDNQTVPIT